MLFVLPMLCYLCAFGCIYIIIAIKTRKLQGKTVKDFANELITAAMWFVGALVYPFAYSAGINSQVRDYFNIFTDVAMVGIFLAILVIIGRQKLVVSRQPALKASRDFEVFASKFHSEYTLRKDIDRKAFQVMIPVFVLIMYVLGLAVISLLSVDFVSGHDLGIFLIINCGFGGLFLFAAADVVRLSFFFKSSGISIFHLLPTTVLDILTKRMHTRELYTFIPTVLILLSFIPFLPAPFSVFAAVSLQASREKHIAKHSLVAASSRLRNTGITSTRPSQDIVLVPQPHSSLPSAC
jgi:hypothetical protein